MGQRLKGKGAVVTGSGQGIGRAVAIAMAQEGARVVTNNRQAGTEGGDAETTAQHIRAAGGKAVAIFADVGEYESAGRLVQACVDNFGRMDIVVNCAANVGPGAIHEMTEKDWDDLIRVHLKGTFNTCRHATPLMKAQGSGRIINTTSNAWYGITAGSAAYSAAKGGIVSLTREIAREMGAFGLTCNAIAPEAATRIGPGNPITDHALREWYRAGMMSEAELHFFLNLPGPECVAPFYVYLATDRAANINGRVFRCGDGVVALYAEPFELKGIYKDHKKDGPWTLEELTEIVPRSLTTGLGPIPPYPPRDKAPF
jgi:3-oxoacyl-[acyl-carrier protein] reductase